MSASAGDRQLGAEVRGRPSQAGGPHASLPWLAAWLAFLPIAILRAGTLAESDTFWQIRTGLLTMSRMSLPRVDSYSWTAAGEPWTQNSWGFNVILALAHQAAGLPGVALAGAALVMIIAGLVLCLARRLGAAPVVAAGLLIVAATYLVGWFAVRPQLGDYAAVLILVLLLTEVVRGRRPGMAVLGVGVLTVVWVNLHAATALGLAIVGICAVLVLLTPSARSRGGWIGLALALTLLGSAVNPYGLAFYTQAFAVRSASVGLIDEWQGIDPRNLAQMAVLLIGVLALALTARRGELVLVAALACSAAGAIAAVRLLPILLVLSIPVMAGAASHASVLDYLRSRRAVLIPGAGVGLVAVAALAAPSLGHLGRPHPGLYSPRIVSQIPDGCALYNDYLTGGYVILMRPDVLVSLDSRNDLYGEARVAGAGHVIDGDGDPSEALAGAECVLIPTDSRLASRLELDAGWDVLASDPVSSLLVRRRPAPSLTG